MITLPKQLKSEEVSVSINSDRPGVKISDFRPFSLDLKCRGIFNNYTYLYCTIFFSSEEQQTLQIDTQKLAT